MTKKLLSTLYFLLFTGALFAQSASVSGKITDENGLPMPGALVVLTDINRGAITDNQGSFTLLNVPTGSYQIKISFIGYATIEQDVEVTSGISLDFNMQVSTMLGDEVVVIGDRLKGQAKALNQQKTNSNITNIVASDQMGRFPDANIGDAMKRIPGITMQYDQGEARDIIIRGMAPQLNSVTLNGERLPSAEGDNRRIQMDLIPSDMIQTVEVNKAVLPNMDADAIGGSVNLVTRRAPENFRFSGTLASGVNLLSDKPIYTGSFTIGDRILNDKLGVILSASYNNHDFGSNDIEAVWIDTDEGAVIDEFDIREYQVQRVRRSTSLALDYDINSNHSLYLSSMYNWRDDWENRFRMRVSSLEDAFDDGAFTKLENGTYDITDGRVEYQTKGGLDSDRIKAARLEDQRVYNVTLGGKHVFNKLKSTWSVTYAKASEERPNERYMSFRNGGQNILMDVRNPEEPFAYLTNRQDNFNLELNEITEQYGYTEDVDLNGKLDFQYQYSESGIFKFGGRFRSKDKNRENNFFEYSPLDDNLITTLSSVPNSDQSNPDFLAGSQYQAGFFATPEYLGGLDLSNPAIFEKEDVLDEYLPGNYEAKENIYAGYVMADHQFTQKFSAIVGVRYEFTDIEYTGNILDLDEETFTKETRSSNYANFLPGVHLKYDINPEFILRMAWTNTIARPNYFDLVPYAEFSPGDQELARGNPDLEATTAMNFDLMAEKYFSTVGLISGGLFYKDVDNFIYGQTVQNYADPQFGTDLEYSFPRNGGTASVYGFEASFQKQIWKGLGLYLNYTRTESSTEGIEEREDDDLELPGTANNMFNASLSYETEKLVVRVSVNYASDYIDEIGGDSFEDRFYDEQTFLDINASYAITPKFRVFLEGNNLTNQPLRYYQGIQSRTMQGEYYNARFNIGAKFDLFKK
uniref:TonB-dependent receptor n=1 Tax=Fulvivirga sp. TaxID=1931237 RepID=UPI00404A588C